MGRWRWVYILVLAPTLALYPFAIRYSRGVDPLLFEQWPMIGCLALTVAVSRGAVRRRLRWRRRLLAVGIPVQCLVLLLDSALVLAGLSSGVLPPGGRTETWLFLWLVAGCEASYGSAFYLLVSSWYRL